MYITKNQIIKPKTVRFLKFKFQTVLKLNFNGGQFYKKILPLILMTLKQWKSITMHCIAVIMMQFAFEFKTNINLLIYY